MSVPLPAIFVAIVTAPLRPACAIISASLFKFSGFAFNKLWGIPYSFNNEDKSSDFSTLVVPINTGRPKVCISRHSSATDLHLAY